MIGDACTFWKTFENKLNWTLKIICTSSLAKTKFSNYPETSSNVVPNIKKTLSNVVTKSNFNVILISNIGSFH